MPYAGRVDKTMGAVTVGHLQHLLDTELRRTRDESGLDMALFLGVDGRIFASSIPDVLDPRQYRLLSLLKGNLGHICNQLAGQNMMMSVQQFEAGTVVISGVGERAFLVFLTTKRVEITKMQSVLSNVVKASIVVRHLFESKPITPEVLGRYDEAVATELKKLTRILFVEKFEETKEFRKNKEIEAFLRGKLAALVAPGQLEEIVTLGFNEIGTSTAYMTPNHWDLFVTFIVDRLRDLRGDAVAEKADREWRIHLRHVLSSFV
jgi:predicted regulator of Ras-like GTPase activity (Roadblock/LC7/MglB family)